MAELETTDDSIEVIDEDEPESMQPEAPSAGDDRPFPEDKVRMQIAETGMEFCLEITLFLF